ncbi:sporulation integral membrane protein YtvI [Peribacillus sp. SCS-155]|uniref:sporulation integral membrane protein YtvI n=1 Tax=Peribacillus sedimenti TaxID=3115297 RepID=UPI003905F056
MKRFFTKKPFILLFIAFTSLLLAFYLIPISLPIVTAFITALFLEPLNNKLQQKLAIKHRWSAALVFIGFILVFLVSIYFLTTKVITDAVQFIRQAPGYINDVSQIWSDYEARMETASAGLPQAFVEQAGFQINKLLNRLREELGGLISIQQLSAFITLLPNYLVSLLVYFIALILFMLDLPDLRRRIYSCLSDSTADKVRYMSSRMSFVIIGFLKAQFFMSVLIFLVALVGLLMIHPETALFTAFIIWIMDFIPIIGSVMILGPWSLFNLLTGDIVLAAKLAILGVVIIIIRRTVEPKVMGSQIGLSSLTTLISMYIGWQLLGIFGFLIGPFLLIAINSASEAGLFKLERKGM